ncbi:MAG: hypothetical protein ACRBBU_08605 [Pseudooceanicola sp.]
MILSLIPFGAAAETCGTQRPDWAPEVGTTSALGEAIHVLTAWPVLILIAALITAMAWRLTWLAAPICCLFSGAAIVMALPAAPANTGKAALAGAERCTGPMGLSVALMAVLALVAFWVSLPMSKKPG